MAVYLSSTYGWNPGYGMQTSNVVGGTETLYHINLGNPKGKPATPYANGDDILLLKTKIQNRITRLVIKNYLDVQFMPSFFLAYIKDGKIVFPKYSIAAGNPTACYYSLACSIDVNHLTARGFAFSDDSGILDVWNRDLEDADAGKGGTKFVVSRVAAGAANSALPPYLEPNLASIMDKALRANLAADAADLNPDGLSGMSAIDTDCVICMHIGAAGLTAAQASQVEVEIGIMETDISANNATEAYVKNWNQIPVGGVTAGDGLKLDYVP
jgi:hypothetical protein